MPAITQKFMTKLIVPNIYNHSVSVQIPTQNLTYKEVILLFAIDINFISLQTQQDSVLLPYMYRQVESQTSDYSVVPSIVSSSFDSSNSKQFAIGISFMVITVLFIVPLLIMLNKRLRIHERVFDLLSSI